MHTGAALSLSWAPPGAAEAQGRSSSAQQPFPDTKGQCHTQHRLLWFTWTHSSCRASFVGISVSTLPTCVLNGSSLQIVNIVGMKKLSSSSFYYMYCCKSTSLWQNRGLTSFWEVKHQFSGLKRYAGELRLGQEHYGALLNQQCYPESQILYKYHKAS